MSDDLEQLEKLKARADQLSISYHPSIGIEKLREKINEKIGTVVEESLNEEKTIVKGIAMTKEQADRTMVNYKRKEATRNVRCRVTNMNPSKREWEGEIIEAANDLVDIKKYVPFNGEPYHIPRFLLNVMKERKCQVFKTVKGPRGNKVRKGHLINEFNIEILPDLTPKEATELMRQQQLAKASD
jgi:hypothetical protein